jgi:hypothetical protein
MSSAQDKPQPTPSEQPLRSPIIRLGPPMAQLPEGLEFSEKQNPVRITVETLDTEGNVTAIEVIKAAGVVVISDLVLKYKGEKSEVSIVMVDAATTFDHRADIVDIMRKFELSLYMKDLHRPAQKVVEEATSRA